MVKADATGCLVSKPAKFRVVHQDKTTGYVVWRPVARKGQVRFMEYKRQVVHRKSYVMPRTSNQCEYQVREVMLWSNAAILL